MQLLRKLINKVNIAFANSSTKRKIAYLRKQGCTIGENVQLNCNTKTFGTEPYLISIGNNCLIAEEVRFITHDGGIFVLNNMEYFGGGVRMDKIAPIACGNNVYIGTGAYIMPGVRIGNNCIIGAKALVTRSIPDNCVAVGIPARVVEDIQAYYQHAKQKGHLYETARVSRREKRAYFESIQLAKDFWKEE